MKQIKTLNAISPVINGILGEGYRVADDAEKPIGILLRSFDMHGYALDAETVAVARAGAGTNNIPVKEYAEAGVIVFNTPGANANAVKELTLSALLLGARDVISANRWVDTLKGRGEEVAGLVEKGKGAFAGGELLGKTLCVVGLGAIGALVANAALGLGMRVVGYDPFLSVNAALRLSCEVEVMGDLTEAVAVADYVTLHIPYIADKNRELFDDALIGKMKDGTVIVNCARGEIVSTDAVIKALADGKLRRYVVDFPCDGLIGVKGVVCIPHLGASTEEAEENCAVMAARQLRDYIENGNIVNSVNFPTCTMPRTTENRLVILHKNTHGILAEITGAVGREGINISNLTNQSKGDCAVTILDIDAPVSEAAVEHIRGVGNVIRVRVIA